MRYWRFASTQMIQYYSIILNVQGVIAVYRHIAVTWRHRKTVNYDQNNNFYWPSWLIYDINKFPRYQQLRKTRVCMERKTCWPNGRSGYSHFPYNKKKPLLISRPSQIACMFTTVYVTCMSKVLRVHEKSCTVLILLWKNNLNLPISHSDHYALRE